jgi:hypothetical protein
VNEKVLQTAIVDLAEIRGWLVYHTHDSRRSAPGFPDLVLVRGERLIFAELKSETGRVSPDQRLWLQALERTDAEVYLWKPEDWPARVLEVLDR